jgi:CDP-diacylglycerol--glycerol-3-phosphate 3-phosphatidyltransferase
LAKGLTPRGVADVVTVSRVPLAVAMVAVALASDSPSRSLLVALLGVGFAPDLLDGWLARREGAASERGARLDSLADAALSVAVGVALFATVEWPIAAWGWWAIGVVGAVRIAAIATTYARFRLVSVAHTWANKASGAAIALAAMWTLAHGHLGGWPVAVACAIALVAALEEWVIAATSFTYDRDRRGCWDRTRPSPAAAHPAPHLPAS